MNDSDNPQVAAEQARDAHRKTAVQVEKLALDTPLPEAMRAVAEKNVAQTREVYERSKDALEAPLETVERSFRRAGPRNHAQTAKQGYPMRASDRERETYPIVYFEDLALDIPGKGGGEGLACNAQDPSGFRPEVVMAAFDKAFDAATEGTRLLQGEMIGIAQRNVNAIFNQLRKLAGAKSLGDILDLQAAYCRNQLGAFIRQVEEIQAVSTEVANGLAKPIETDVSSSSMASFPLSTEPNWEETMPEKQDFQIPQELREGRQDSKSFKSERFNSQGKRRRWLHVGKRVGQS